MLKAFFADHALSKDDVLSELRAIVAWADASHEPGRGIARGYIDGSTCFGERPRASPGKTSR